MIWKNHQERQVSKFKIIINTNINNIGDEWLNKRVNNYHLKKYEVKINTFKTSKEKR